MNRNAALLLLVLHVRQIGVLATDIQNISKVFLPTTDSGQTPCSQNAFPPECPTTCNCSFIVDKGTDQNGWKEEKDVPSLSIPTVQRVRVVVCRDLGLRVPPQNLPSDTYSLDLSGNSLLPGSLVLLRGLYNLQRLVVTRCKIRTMEELFTGGQQRPFLALHSLVLDSNELMKLASNHFLVTMATLKSLSLANNRIDSIHANAFAGLVQLEDLNLSNNGLFTLLDNQWMFFLPGLRRLNLSGNHIHALHNSSFGYLSGIRLLDLRSNRLRQIQMSAFLELANLMKLDLSRNNLMSVPSSALAALNSLAHLDFSDNLVEEIPKGSFWNLSSLASLTLSKMKRLQIVDELSFVNLVYLTRLEISGCSRLAYIHSDAFRNVDRLKTLVLHSNALETVEEGISRSLPSLTELDLHSNPFTCDCVMRWLVSKQNLLTSLNGGFPTCSSPVALKDASVVDVPVDRLSKKCGPRVLPLFKEQTEVVVSDSLLLRCLAVGLPPPSTTWILPHSVKIQEENNPMVSFDVKPEATVTTADSLFIRSAAIADAGQYKCVATNAMGTDDRSTYLRVKPSTAALVVLRVGSTSVTFTWKNTTQGREYRLTYHEVSKQPPAQQTTVVVFIGRQMRTFTARNLPPRTDHEFCLSVRVPAYKEEDRMLYQNLNCTTVTTVDQMPVESGVYSAVPLVVAAGVGVITLVSGMLVCVFVVARRYNHKRAQGGYGPTVPRGSDFEGFLEGTGGYGDENIMVPLSETYENESALKLAEDAIFDETDLDEIRRSAILMINPIATTRLLPPSAEQTLT